ncbi:hypothetical protein [Niveispirillum fermenti]|uniref:hypothetical protein n=1 Tax=Niveispirillum fermenti TaxID=1233113 RepID=UPI003A8560DF
MPTTTYDPSSIATLPPANDAAFDSVEVLTDQILTAVARSQKLGHRGTRITLTRPTETVEGVRNRLLMAGLAPVVRASSVGGQSVLSLRC